MLFKVLSISGISVFTRSLSSLSCLIVKVIPVTPAEVYDSNCALALSAMSFCSSLTALIFSPKSVYLIPSSLAPFSDKPNIDDSLAFFSAASFLIFKPIPISVVNAAVIQPTGPVKTAIAFFIIKNVLPAIDPTFTIVPPKLVNAFIPLPIICSIG